MATWIGSPNFTKGRGSNSVSLILVHHMDGNLASTDAVFQDRTRDTSAHYGVSRSGEVHQYVDEADTAYHAGNYAINQASIGIEHEDLGANDYTDLEYETSAGLIRQIGKAYGFPINSQTVRRHRDFFATACPGTLDVDRLITLANQGDNDMIPNEDHLQALFRAFRGRPAQPEEVKQYVGTPYSSMVEALDSGPERDAAVKAVAVGQAAVGEDWRAQIDTLKKQLATKGTELKAGSYFVK